MKLRRLCLSLACTTGAIAALTPPVLAQSTTALAQLNGTVRDASGSEVAGAAITLRETRTNRVYSTLSLESGFFVVPDVAPGHYELTVELMGFAGFKQTGLALSVGQMATVDVVLGIQGISEPVIVATGGVATEPTRTESSQVISSNEITSLPITGRQFIDFALLTPGVATGRTSFQSPFSEPETTRVAFGGQRDLNNAVTVDGADFLNSATSSQRATPSQEAVSEFRVVNNSFAVEYGRALGGIVNIVTKSGTNDWHGSVYEFFRDDAIDERSILTLPQFDKFRQNQFGFTLGGPIKKDRTFVFVNYEGQRRKQSPTYPDFLVQNLDAINNAKTSLGLKPENLDILKTNDSDNAFARIDDQLGKNHQLSLRYLFVDSRNLNLLVGDTLDGGGVGAPSSGRNGLLRDQSAVATLTSRISPTLSNTAMVQLASRKYDFRGVTGEPNLDLPNLLLTGHNFGSFERVDESRLQLSDTLSVVRGVHYAKFGIDTHFVRDYVISPGFTPARIVFPSLNCLMTFAHQPQVSTDGPCPLPPVFGGVAAFFWGAPVGPGSFDPNQPSPPVPTTWEAPYLASQAPNFDVRLNHGYHGIFAQDQWRLSRKLTLNYGLRYDFESGLGYFIKGDRNNIAPRLGIAYAPDSKTVVRAGYGLFYDRYNLTFLFIAGNIRPSIINGLPSNITTGRFLVNLINVQNGPPPVAPDEAARAARTLLQSGTFPPNLRVYQGGPWVDPDSQTPYSGQASLQIERQMSRNLLLTAGYLFVGSHKQARAANRNIGLPVGADADGKPLFGFNKVDPGAGFSYQVDNSGNVAYHGLSVSAAGRYGSRLRFNASYTLSKTLDDGTFTVFVGTPQDFYHREQERALSIQNVRHRFVSDFVLAGPDTTWLRHFELSGIVTLQSPRPFTIFVGFDANQDTNPVTDRVGLAARNTYQGDSFKTVDLRLSRYIELGRGRKLQLMVEAFNLFNRANVNEVNTVYGAPDFVDAVPTHYQDGAAAPSPFFGTPRNVFNPRQLQLAARFTF
jgi:hypothetical protein